MKRPNIVYILADDMGYGDMECNNSASKIPTPNLNRLAEQGMRFTDAHAGSSVCTPSRYSIMTGRYCLRSRLKEGIVWQWDGALIELEQKTVAQLLREQDYRTACIGKWHLGLDWTLQDGSQPSDHVNFGEMVSDQRAEIGQQIDYTKRIGGGPLDRGFESYFGVDVPNFPPYTWFENDRVAEVPTMHKPDEQYGHPGASIPGWSLEQMVPEFTRRAVDYIESQASAEKPFFLYLPLTSPHSPVVPKEEFKGKSGIGNYGDFVCEVDWVVGKVVAALERSGLSDDTLVIFTSDNGPESGTHDEEGAYLRAKDRGHYSMGELRGVKRDLWEGGHRVPFIAKWPREVSAGVTCDQLISLSDFMATCVEMSGATLAEGEAEDSVSILKLLRGEDGSPVREFAVHHSCNGGFAVRRGDWVYIDYSTGEDNGNGMGEPDWYKEERGYVSHEHPAELFHLGDDPAERRNRYADEPELVAEMKALLRKIQGSSISPPSTLGDELLTE
jgi:arylsulfatase A